MEVITDVLQIAALAPYPATLYVGALPSGGRVAIAATATFGDVFVALLLVMLVAIEIAALVRRWKHS